MGKDKKQTAPRSKFGDRAKRMEPIPGVEFDVGKMVFNYLVAFHLQRHFVETGHPMQMHFGGIINGYDDWFTALSIGQDQFDMVYEKIPRDTLKSAVEDLIPKFKAQYDKEMGGEGKIMIPGQEPKSSKALMDGFKDLLREKQK